jgi:hypothetical protein
MTKKHVLQCGQPKESGRSDSKSPYPRTDGIGDFSAISNIAGIISSSSQKWSPPSVAPMFPWVHGQSKTRKVHNVGYVLQPRVHFSASLWGQSLRSHDYVAEWTEQSPQNGPSRAEFGIQVLFLPSRHKNGPEQYPQTHLNEVSKNHQNFWRRYSRDTFILINTIKRTEHFPQKYFNANHIFKVLFLSWI